MAKRNKWVPEDESEVNTVDIIGDNGVLVTYEAPALPIYTPILDAPLHAVSFALSRGVLVALLDSDHELADVAGATVLGLLSAEGLTNIGELVRAGIVDETAIRHKMATAWRNAHNAALGGKKA